MASRVQLIGMNDVIAKYNSFMRSGAVTLDIYLEFIGQRVLDLLKQNTPVDTGALRDSWHIMSKDTNSITIGVTDEQEDTLQAVIYGTNPSDGFFVPVLGYRVTTHKSGKKFKRQHPGTPKNDFVDRVRLTINALITETLQSAMRQNGHPYYEPLLRLSNPMQIKGGYGAPRVGGKIRKYLGSQSLNRKTVRIPSGKRKVGLRRRGGVSNWAVKWG